MTFKYVVVTPFSHNGKKYKRGDVILAQDEAGGLHEGHRHKRTVKVHMTAAEEAEHGTGKAQQAEAADDSAEAEPDAE